MPKFIENKDVNLFQEINKEMYRSMFKPITVLPLLDSPHDPVYLEDMNKSFGPAYELEAFLPTLSKFEMKQRKEGIDERRDLVVHFSIDLAKERGVPLPKIGDRLIIQNDTYQIQQDTVYSDYGSNLQIPLTHSCTIIRVRPERPEQGTVVHEEF